MMLREDFQDLLQDGRGNPNSQKRGEGEAGRKSQTDRTRKCLAEAGL